MAAKAASASPIESFVTVDEAGRMIGIGGERIRQLVKAGFIEKAGRNRLTIEAVGNGYRKYRDNLASQETKTSADSRVRDARAKEIEMRVAKEERSLIPIEDTDYAMAFAAAKFRDALMSLPARYTRDLAERRKLEDFVHADLNAMADVFAAASRSMTDGNYELYGPEGNSLT